MDLYQTLYDLTTISAPAGYVKPVSDLAEQLLAPLVDEVSRDRLDNVFGVRRCGRKQAHRVLLDAHLDEIGFLVTGHEEGYLRFRNLGGVDSRMLPGREIRLLTNPEGFGIVATRPPHALSADEREQALGISELCIDVGMSQEEAERAYPVGTVAVYREKCTRLQGSRVAGKAMDNRSCFCVILRALELLKDKTLPYDLWVLGSNMEETGGKGATVGAFRVMPECAVVLDVTFATQSDVTKRHGFELGCGPAIGVGPEIPQWMTRLMRKSAQTLGIPEHLEIMTGRTGTNGDSIQISREGVAMQVLSLPIRYMHTPIEELDLEDMETAARLLAQFLLDLGEEAPRCLNW